MSEHEPEVEVASAIVVRAGRLLLQQRPEGKDFAFTWECPGGKVEAGESPRRALVREVRDEVDLVCLGIDTPAVWSGVFDAPVSRPDRARVRVSFYRVSDAVGSVVPREWQGWGWFSQAEVLALDGAGVLSPANKRAMGAILKSAFGVALRGPAR